MINQVQVDMFTLPVPKLASTRMSYRSWRYEHFSFTKATAVPCTAANLVRLAVEAYGLLQPARVSTATLLTLRYRNRGPHEIACILAKYNQTCHCKGIDKKTDFVQKSTCRSDMSNSRRPLLLGKNATRSKGPRY